MSKKANKQINSSQSSEPLNIVNSDGLLNSLHKPPELVDQLVNKVLAEKGNFKIEKVEDYFRIKNLSPEYLDLLLEAGISQISELSNLDPDILLEKLTNTNRQKKIVRKLPSIDNLSQWIEGARKIMSPHSTKKSFDIDTITVIEGSSKSNLRLTPEYLELKLTPYLQAISDLQMILSKLMGNIQKEVEIKAITKFSPLSISLEGASDALQLVREVVTPWRRKHSLTIANLAEVKIQIEIETKKAEILEKRAIAEKTRLESKKIREEIKKMELENQQLGIVLQKDKINFVIEILQKINQNLEDNDKIIWISTLIPIIDRIIYSDLEIN